MYRVSDVCASLDSSILFATLHVGKASGAVPLSDRGFCQTNTTIVEPLLVALKIGDEQ